MRQWHRLLLALLRRDKLLLQDGNRSLHEQSQLLCRPDMLGRILRVNCPLKAWASRAQAAKPKRMACLSY